MLTVRTDPIPRKSVSILILGTFETFSSGGLLKEQFFAGIILWNQ